VKIISESSARRLQLEKGDLDIADSLPVDQFAALKKQGDVAVYDYPALRVTYLYLNNGKAPLSQPDLRRTISWATDYKGWYLGFLPVMVSRCVGQYPRACGDMMPELCSILLI
jgi:peptide/nickel transport system substrate-binding protein